MGLLDSILKPFQDLIKGVEKAESIFGEAIEMTVEAIEKIISMMEEIRHLFNEKEIEKIFFKPFEEAVILVFDSLKAIFQELEEISPKPDGVVDLLKDSVKGVYNILSDSLKFLKEEGNDIKEHLTKTTFGVINFINNKFESFEVVIESFPDKLKELTERIVEEFKIEKEKLIDVIPEFEGFSKKELLEIKHKITTNVTNNVESFKSVEQSMKRKIESDLNNIDFIIIVFVILFVIFIGIIYYITRSIMSVKIVIILFSIIFFIYIIDNHLTNIFQTNG